MKFQLKHKKFNTKGKLSWEYNPLHNLTKVQASSSDNNVELKTVLDDFDTDRLALDINHPVDIECQPSYDGSTNIIINDDYNVPRIVNSAFSVLEDNSYERVSRNQVVQTNRYKEDSIDSETRLQRTTSTFAHFDLKECSEGGQLQGGNYVFLAQYSDDDDNKTSVIAESGIVSIYNGHYSYLDSIKGTLLYEKTDKQIKFIIDNVDNSFNKLYISYRRDFSDLTGTKQSEFKTISRPYEIKDKCVELIINGLEETIDTTYDALTAKNNVYHKIKTQVQNQNMLFFGNVEESYDNIKTLQLLSLYIQVQPVWGNSVGNVNQAKYRGNKGSEYFNPNTIYDNVGYMPEEYYRLGVVFIYNDDSKSAVYNLRGRVYETMYQWNHIEKAPSKEVSDSFINDLFIGNSTTNTKGVFKMPSIDMYATDVITPINLEFKIPSYIAVELKKLNIKGCYFVRQKRIPVFLTQGFSIGVSDNAFVPLMGSFVDTAVKYRLDSFLNMNDSRNQLTVDGFITPILENVHTRGLFCPDIVLNKQLQSLMGGASFKLRKVGMYNTTNLFPEGDDSDSTINATNSNKRVHVYRWADNDDKIIERELVYIPEKSSFMSYKNSAFSTKAGSSSDVKSLRTIDTRDQAYLNNKCVRGEFTPFIGVVDSTISETNMNVLDNNTVYNVYTKEYGSDKDTVKKSITTRAYDHSIYTAVCDPIKLDTDLSEQTIICSGGDCFTCTTAHKFCNNFLDYTTPLNQTIVKGLINKGKSKKNVPTEAVNSLFDNQLNSIDASAWNEFNVSDVNSCDFGFYITTKYMSNFNHNIRSIDDQNIDEINLFGAPRQFLPLGGDISGVGFKIPDSTLCNYGYSSTQRVLPHFEAVQVPYVNSHFDNRIAFSNVASNTSFTNGYRVFSGVSYQDIERTYGAIVKLLPLGANLFCVFEHGCGIVPINEKALLSTTTGQSIHLYGAGVLQEQVTVVSQDYGSTWEDSIVVTPNGIYGVDSWAKKIWRYNANGFELISDQLVQRFLNDNITMSETDWTPTHVLKNVKTHYNAYKGDVMFTFYKNGLCWNLCYNERIDKFVTKYTWSPILSGNIQNSFVSIDRLALEPHALIAENQIIKKGLALDEGGAEDYMFNFEKDWTQYNAETEEILDESADGTIIEYPIKEYACKFNRTFKLKGYDLCDSVIAHVKSVTVCDKDGKISTITNDTEHGFWLNSLLANANIISDDETIKSVEKSAKNKVSAVGWGSKNAEAALSNLDEGEYKIPQGLYYKELGEDSDDDNDRAFNACQNFKAMWSNYVAIQSSTNADIEVKLNDYVNWIKIEMSVTPAVTTLNQEKEDNDESDYKDIKQTCSTKGDPFNQTICLIANRDYLEDTYTSCNDQNDQNYDEKKASEYKDYLKSWDNNLRVGLYTHGRAGIYDEINYTDLDPDNQIKPTYWYGKQEPFEFEFVVNTPTGMQKIFDNLVIISNNAEPESLEISIVGDAYNFNKARIFNSDNTTIPHDVETGILNAEKLNKAKLAAEFAKTNRSQKFDISYNSNTDREIKFHTSVSRDNVLNQYVLNVHEDCRDVKDARWGKRLGNIEYREDKWLVTLSPIMFKNTKPVYNNSTVVDKMTGSINSAKLRDKWCKIRVKYKGDKLVVISALQTFMSLSYS